MAMATMNSSAGDELEHRKRRLEETEGAGGRGADETLHPNKRLQFSSDSNSNPNSNSNLNGYSSINPNQSSHPPTNVAPPPDPQPEEEQSPYKGLEVS